MYTCSSCVSNKVYTHTGIPAAAASQTTLRERHRFENIALLPWQTARDALPYGVPSKTLHIYIYASIYIDIYIKKYI
jgi:hypothetical protein